MLKADTQRTLINPIKSARDFVASWSSEHKANPAASWAPTAEPALGRGHITPANGADGQYTV